MNPIRIPIQEDLPQSSFHIDIHHEPRFRATVGKTSETSTSQKRILIVDDERASNRSLRLNLEASAGYAVRMVNDATGAIHAARKSHPHSLLLDGLTGRLADCEVFARTHADPELADTPIVFLAALPRNKNPGVPAVDAGSIVDPTPPETASRRWISSTGRPWTWWCST